MKPEVTGQSKISIPLKNRKRILKMNIGKLIRLNRLFSHPGGKFLSVAVDHFIGYNEGLPPGLRHIRPTLAALAAAQPDAVTMHKGIALSAWAPHAGRVPLIVQSMACRADDTACEALATPEDAVRLGADAFAISIFLRGKTEGEHVRQLADAVRQASGFDIPVICHVYPRDFSGPTPRVSFEPDDIAWAVRCAVEGGADVVKVPYCGDVNAYAEIVADCPVPVVAAGGPKSQTLVAALEMIAEVMCTGARGATIGRNVWGFEDITAAVGAFQAVVHAGKSPQEALIAAGI
jgi:class I fructose-bisphosphate aldolase